MPQRASQDKHLGHFTHFNGGLYSGGHSLTLDTVAHGECVHYGGQHTDVITGNPVHALLICVDTSMEITAAHNDGDLYALLVNLDHFLCDSSNYRRIDTKLLRAHESLAGEFQQNPLIAA